MAQSAVAALLEEKLRSVAQVVEDSVDSELHRLETLTEDDLEGMRRRRLEQLKRAAARKQEWLQRGHGEYKDIPGEKARPMPKRRSAAVPRDRPPTRPLAGVLCRDEGRGAARLPLLPRVEYAMQGTPLRLAAPRPPPRVSALCAAEERLHGGKRWQRRAAARPRVNAAAREGSPRLTLPPPARWWTSTWRRCASCTWRPSLCVLTRKRARS